MSLRRRLNSVKQLLNILKTLFTNDRKAACFERLLINKKKHNKVEGEEKDFFTRIVLIDYFSKTGSFKLFRSLLPECLNCSRVFRCHVKILHLIVVESSPLHFTWTSVSFGHRQSKKSNFILDVRSLHFRTDNVCQWLRTFLPQYMEYTVLFAVFQSRKCRGLMRKIRLETCSL